eukprot:7695059-Ditylum_brightwellii.AAC.1
MSWLSNYQTIYRQYQLEITPIERNKDEEEKESKTNNTLLGTESEDIKDEHQSNMTEQEYLQHVCAGKQKA